MKLANPFTAAAVAVWENPFGPAIVSVIEELDVDTTVPLLLCTATPTVPRFPPAFKVGATPVSANLDATGAVTVKGAVADVRPGLDAVIV